MCVTLSVLDRVNTNKLKIKIIKIITTSSAVTFELFLTTPHTFKGEYLKKNRKVGEKHVFENPHYGPFSADQCDQGDGDPISELLRYSVSNMSTIYYTKLPNMAPELNDIEFDKQVPNLPIFN